MKKSMIFAAALLLSAATASFSQKTNTPNTTQGSTSGTTSSSTNSSTPSANTPSNTAGTQVQDAGNTGQNKQGNANQAGNSDKSNSGGEQAQKTTVGDASTRPGGATHENADDVGRYSDNADSKSMTHSKEALEQRRKNLTESDTTLKKGSGSAPKNMKDHTGKTGNYQNQEIKHNQKTTPRP